MVKQNNNEYYKRSFKCKQIKRIDVLKTLNESC